ncbi:MAG: hypothetical protein Kow0083_00160 [Methylophaga sp.]
MKISRQHLADAVLEKIISEQQAEDLYQFLRKHSASGPVFDLTHVLYYLGGLIAIGAMTLFMTLGWEAFGGWGLFFIALLYAGVGMKLIVYFQDRNLVVPAGICATFVVALTPLAAYGLQQGLGVWPDSSSYREYYRYIQWHWLYMELATLAVGAAMVWRYKYPFLLMPVAVTLWYLSMDLAAWLAFGRLNFEIRALVSLYFGALMILLAFWVDIRTRDDRADYAFWLYLFGVLTFWCGLSMQNSDSELAKLGYCIINLFMIVIGVALMRRVFVVFGAFGVAGYLGYLSHEVFEDSWLFPLVLSLAGLLIIYLGVLWQKHEQTVSLKLRSCLPMALQQLIGRH